jgi:hypothetical protein
MRILVAAATWVARRLRLIADALPDGHCGTCGRVFASHGWTELDRCEGCGG